MATILKNGFVAKVMCNANSLCETQPSVVHGSSMDNFYILRERVPRRFVLGAVVSVMAPWRFVAHVRDLWAPPYLSRGVVRALRGLATLRADLVLEALDMALERRRARDVIHHSDQGCQFTGHEWQTFLSEHNLVSSMSRRGNCHDNAVAESFFQLLKRERIRRQIYSTRDDARADVFHYIEMFYNPRRRHGTAEGLSPVEFERRQSQRLKSV